IILAIAVASVAIYAAQRFIRSSPGRTLATKTTSIARALVAIAVFLALMYPSLRLKFITTFVMSLVLITLLHRQMRTSTKQEGYWYHLGNSILLASYLSLVLSGTVLILSTVITLTQHQSESEKLRSEEQS
ncbi:MAG: hypothetical protein WBO98_10860, partial [Candidatus Nitrotoga sp.]